MYIYIPRDKEKYIRKVLTYISNVASNSPTLSEFLIGVATNDVDCAVIQYDGDITSEQASDLLELVAQINKLIDCN